MITNTSTVTVFVGIDVSKDHLDVHFLESAKHVVVENKTQAISKLIVKKTQILPRRLSYWKQREVMNQWS